MEKTFLEEVLGKSDVLILEMLCASNKVRAGEARIVPYNTGLKDASCSDAEEAIVGQSTTELLFCG